MKPQRKLYKTVILDRDFLLYDINFESWKIAKCKIEAKPLQAEISTDEEADMFIQRSIDTAIGNIKNELLWCINNRSIFSSVQTDRLDQDFENPAEGVHYPADVDFPTDEAVYDETDGGLISDTTDTTAIELHEDHEPEARFPRYFTIEFVFPDYWRGSLESLKVAIHNYVTRFVLSEWFALTKPDESERYLALAASYMKKAVECARQEDVKNVIFRL